MIRLLRRPWMTSSISRCRWFASHCKALAVSAVRRLDRKSVPSAAKSGEERSHFVVCRSVARCDHHKRSGIIDQVQLNATTAFPMTCATGRSSGDDACALGSRGMRPLTIILAAHSLPTDDAKRSSSALANWELRTKKGNARRALADC